MAQQIIEQLQTRDYAVSNGQATGSRKWIIFDDSSPITVPQTVIDAFGGGTLPLRGDAFPSSLVLFAKNYKIERVAGTDIWGVTWDYASGQPQDRDPLEIGYVEVTIDHSAQFDDSYRRGTTFPSNGTPTTDNDIGGERIDVVGSPLSLLRYKIEFTVTETVDYSTFVNILTPNILDATGTRNSRLFQGTPAGKLVYKGASARRVGLDTWSVSHSMQADSRYHLIQVPMKGANGEVTVDQYAKPYVQAVKVMFMQPFDGFSNFSGISPNWS